MMIWSDNAETRRQQLAAAWPGPVVLAICRRAERIARESERPLVALPDVTEAEGDTRKEQWFHA